MDLNQESPLLETPVEEKNVREKFLFKE